MVRFFFFAGAAGAVALRRWLHSRGGARLAFIPTALLRACALGLIGCLALAGLLGPRRFPRPARRLVPAQRVSEAGSDKS